ncbi:MAG TPA: glycosyltransferase, partial [Pseudonocardiaceae bacterium]|nr:glycosyltransferase [Pseudonocardiaceae bacterium]
MSVAFLVYVYVIIVPYLRHKPTEPGDPNRFEWHFLVPCRDEEAVIGPTIRYLRTTFPQAHVWVIDDDSDDRTSYVVEGLRHGHGEPSRYIHLVRRKRPHARTGK